MADVVVTFKIMLKDPKFNIKSVEEKVKNKIKEFGGEVNKVEIEPIAFGLNAIKVTFVVAEKKGGLDPLEKDIENINEVSSLDVIDVRRRLG